MVDMTLIQGAISGLKTASDIAKGILQLKSLADVQGKVIDLQTTILAAQSSAIAAQSDQFTMLEEVRALKEEIAKVKAWETEKQRYQMVSPYIGSTVYAVKKSMSNGEPPHYICTNCYENGKRSILQCRENSRHNRFAVFACPNQSCQSEVPTLYSNCESAKYAEDVITQR